MEDRAAKIKKRAIIVSFVLFCLCIFYLYKFGFSRKEEEAEILLSIIIGVIAAMIYSLRLLILLGKKDAKSKN